MKTASNPWKDTPDLPQRIAAAIARLATIQRSLRWQGAAAEGLNPAQSDVLELLAARREGLRLSMVAKQIGVTTASASDTVSALVGKGLVRKSPALDDARAIALFLTRDGSDVAERVANHAALIASSAGRLSEVGQSGLYQQLVALILALQEDERFAQARPCVSCAHFDAYRHRDDAFPHHCRLLDAPLSEVLLRFDCQEHVQTDDRKSMTTWLARLDFKG